MAHCPVDLLCNTGLDADMSDHANNGFFRWSSSRMGFAIREGPRLLPRGYGPGKVVRPIGLFPMRRCILWRVAYGSPAHPGITREIVPFGYAAIEVRIAHVLDGLPCLRKQRHKAIALRCIK